MEYSLSIMKNAGYRITSQRIDIIKLLAVKKKVFSAQQVFKQIQKKHPHISLDTVYRTLLTLTRLGLVNQINLQNGETVKFEFQGEHHHHHAVCLSCGTTVCMETCPVPDGALNSLDQKDFHIINHAFEVYGYCSECRTKKDIN